MKIIGTCKRCGRDFMAEQAVASGGECPWDGQPFQADYAITLVNALAEAERAGTQLERALEQMADLAPEFKIQTESVVGKIRSDLDRIERGVLAGA